MKNYIMVNGRLLQTDKRWDQLSEKQRNWIRQITREAHSAYVKQTNQLSMSSRRQGRGQIVDAVLKQVDQRSIWLPRDTLVREILKIVDRANRRSPLNRHQAGKDPAE